MTTLVGKCTIGYGLKRNIQTVIIHTLDNTNYRSRVFLNEQYHRYLNKLMAFHYCPLL